MTSRIACHRSSPRNRSVVVGPAHLVLVDIWGAAGSLCIAGGHAMTFNASLERKPACHAIPLECISQACVACGTQFTWRNHHCNPKWEARYLAKRKHTRAPTSVDAGKSYSDRL